MKNFMNKLESILLPIAEKLTANKYLTIIREGFVAILPIMIVGSFFVLINNVIIGPNGYLFKWFGISAMPLVNLGNSIIAASLSMTAILLIFTTAKKMAVIEDLDDTIIPVIAIVNFFVLTPILISESLQIEYVSTSYLGTAALFMSFIVAIISTKIIKFFSNIKALKINMPDGVPYG
ncbi:MAG: PTS transporter subunit EIIC, partial [Bacilli bacterium]